MPRHETTNKNNSRAQLGEKALAAIDVGSNAIRLQIVTVRSSGIVIDRESIREPVRLGHRVFLTGLLEEKEMDHAVSVLAAFRATMDRHGVANSRCVATSAVREAQNRDLFVERVANVAGIDLEVISGAEEARLLAIGMRRKVNLAKRKALLVDIGGGSVEIAVVTKGATVLSQSHRLGAVRLSELFLEGARPADEKRALIEEYLERMLREQLREIKKRDPEILLSVGGNAETIARIGGDVEDDKDSDAGSFVDAETLHNLTDRLLELTPAERAKKYDLRPDRVDTIVPAAVMLNFLVERLNLRGFHAPGIGLRDGILAELVDHAIGRFNQSEADQSVVSEAERLGEHYHYDSAHAAKVRELAFQIFDTLRSNHQIAAREAELERTLLGVAATIHDIGEFVGYAHHHKHAYYIISNSELGGVSAEDMRIIATAVRYHRRAHPSDRHPEYTNLSREERKRVSRIAAILRLADALDREHRQKVESLKITIRRNEMLLIPKATGDILLERWAVESKGELFQQVFGLRLQFEGQPESGSGERAHKPVAVTPASRKQQKNLQKHL
ncbi:MAG: HD domain-containing protein [Planctomycetota bacterium]